MGEDLSQPPLFKVTMYHVNCVSGCRVGIQIYNAGFTDGHDS